MLGKYQETLVNVRKSSVDKPGVTEVHAKSEVVEKKHQTSAGSSGLRSQRVGVKVFVCHIHCDSQTFYRMCTFIAL